MAKEKVTEIISNKDQTMTNTNANTSNENLINSNDSNLNTNKLNKDLYKKREVEDQGTSILVKDVDLYYGDFQALKKVNMDIKKGKVTAFIGPSGCGKSTMLRCFNRMNDLVDDCRIEGLITINGNDIYKKDVDVVKLRRNVGMVFQSPNPFSKSVYDNITYGPRIDGIKDKDKLDEIVERSLKSAAIWDEVKDKLDQNALSFSGGQQQRICIARTLSVSPEIVLMDEPTSALDPISTSAIEDLLDQLKENYTIVIVTHNMQQAARISDETAYFLTGEVIEMDDTVKIFEDPSDKRTEDYITGRFGWLMRIRYDEDLELIKKMSKDTMKLINVSYERYLLFLNTDDKENLREIINTHDYIRRGASNLERMCFELLALQQPVASDLRLIQMSIKLASTYKRIASHFEQASMILLEYSITDKEKTFLKAFVDNEMKMADNSMKAFLENDNDLALKTIEEDEKNNRLFNEAITYIADENKRNEIGAIELSEKVLLYKYFERLGDRLARVADLATRL